MKMFFLPLPLVVIISPPQLKNVATCIMLYRSIISCASTLSARNPKSVKYINSAILICPLKNPTLGRDTLGPLEFHSGAYIYSGSDKWGIIYQLQLLRSFNYICQSCLDPCRPSLTRYLYLTPYLFSPSWGGGFVLNQIPLEGSLTRVNFLHCQLLSFYYFSTKGWEYQTDNYT